jgi:hypothetical protein
MPAVSKKQQQAFGIARAVQKGERKAKAGTPSAKIAKTASPKDVEKFASTPTKGLPTKKERVSDTWARPPRGKPETGVNAYLKGRGRVYVDGIMGNTAFVRFDPGEGTRSRQHKVPLDQLDFSREWKKLAGSWGEGEVKEQRYTGPITSARDAAVIIKKLERIGTTEAKAAASLLRRNWQGVAARPKLAADIESLASGSPWRESVNNESVSQLVRKPVRELKRMQNLVRKQIATAHSQKNTQELQRLQAVEKELATALGQKEFGYQFGEGTSAKKEGLNEAEPSSGIDVLRLHGVPEDKIGQILRLTNKSNLPLRNAVLQVLGPHAGKSFGWEEGVTEAGKSGPLTTKDFQKLGLPFEAFLRYGNLSPEKKAQFDKLASQKLGRKVEGANEAPVDPADKWLKKHGGEEPEWDEYTHGRDEPVKEESTKLTKEQLQQIIREEIIREKFDRLNEAFSQLDAIKQAGRKAAEAQHRFHDAATSRSHSDWAKKAIRMEDDPKAAHEAFRQAYKQEASKYVRPTMIR